MLAKRQQTMYVMNSLSPVKQEPNLSRDYNSDSTTIRLNRNCDIGFSSVAVVAVVGLKARLHSAGVRLKRCLHCNVVSLRIIVELFV